MSIVTLWKDTLFGLCNDKAALLESLQAMGVLHLESLRASRERPEEAPPERAEGSCGLGGVWAPLFSSAIPAGSSKGVRSLTGCCQTIPLA